MKAAIADKPKMKINTKDNKKIDDARTAYKKRQDNIAEYIQRIQQKLAADAG